MTQTVNNNTDTMYVRIHNIIDIVIVICMLYLPSELFLDKDHSFLSTASLNIIVVVLHT